MRKSSFIPLTDILSMRTAFLCRRFEDYGEAAARNNALPTGRKRQAVFTVLLFSRPTLKSRSYESTPQHKYSIDGQALFELLKRYLEERWMNGTNCNENERGLLPYPVILAATKGDPDAMKIVIAALPKLHSPFVHEENPRRKRQYLFWRRRLTGTAASKS